MKYSIQNLKDTSKAFEVNDFLFFWGHQPAKDGAITKSCFSQWWVASFEVNGIKYTTAEHWMMAKKAELFNDSAILERILKTESPKDVKALGRKVKNFDAKKWANASYEIVVEGNYHKFSQHNDLKSFLLNTENKIIVEASPYDAIWGIGLKEHEIDITKWKGTNYLGFALMEVRDKLKE